MSVWNFILRAAGQKPFVSAPLPARNFLLMIAPLVWRRRMVGQSRLLALAVLLPCLVSSTATAQETNAVFKNAALRLVQSVVKDGTEAITTSRTLDQPEDQFLAIFSERFSTETIGLRLLGRYWDAANSEERTEFLTAFGTYLADRLIGRFPQGNFTYFDPEEIDINARPRRKQVVVRTVFVASNSSTIINWSVEEIDGQPKIFDIAFRQSSLIDSKHDEFKQILEQNNGSVRGLIAAMEG